MDKGQRHGEEISSALSLPIHCPSGEEAGHVAEHTPTKGAQQRGAQCAFTANLPEDKSRVMLSEETNSEADLIWPRVASESCPKQFMGSSRFCSCGLPFAAHEGNCSSLLPLVATCNLMNSLTLGPLDPRRTLRPAGSQISLLFTNICLHDKCDQEGISLSVS